MRVGVLALQGSYREHMLLLGRVEGVRVVEVRSAQELASVQGLIIPGGESTTMALVAERWGLIPELKAFAAAGKPVWGTCAGMIFLADRAQGAWWPCVVCAGGWAVRESGVRRKVHGGGLMRPPQRRGAWGGACHRSRTQLWLRLHGRGRQTLRAPPPAAQQPHAPLCGLPRSPTRTYNTAVVRAPPCIRATRDPNAAGMKQGGQALLGGLDITVSRNFFGAQVGGRGRGRGRGHCLSVCT